MTGAGLLAAKTITVGVEPTTKVLGLTINTYDVLSALVAGLLVIGIGLAVRFRITAGVPSRMQLVFETLSDAISRQVDTGMGQKGRRVVPLAMALFLFILLCNLLEMIPTGHNPQYLPAPTGDVNLTYALAFTVIVLVHTLVDPSEGAPWLRRRTTSSLTRRSSRSTSSRRSPSRSPCRSGSSATSSRAGSSCC